MNENHQLGQLGGLQSQAPTSNPSSARDRDLKAQQASTGTFHGAGSASRAILIPRQVRDLEDIKCHQICCGQSHSLILTTEGDVYGLGNNSHGQLGFPVQRHPVVSQPLKATIQGGPKIAQIACSSSHTLLLTEAGGLLGAGLNESGQVGLGLGRSRVVVEDFQRVLLPAHGTVEKIWCTDGVSGAAVKASDGSLEIWIWGRFGTDDQMSDCSPRQIPIPPEILNKGGVK